TNMRPVFTWRAEHALADADDVDRAVMAAFPAAKRQRGTTWLFAICLVENCFSNVAPLTKRILVGKLEVTAKAKDVFGCFESRLSPKPSKTTIQ
ncbi:MAG: hypothetical protein AB8B60_19455, partial [Sulfitobacter sp.]